MHALLAVLAATALVVQQPLTRTLGKGEMHAYEVQLKRGESAEVVVAQQGVDVIVELVSPKGVVFDAIDGPTGRQGDEEAEIVAAEGGRYQVRIRPFDDREPVAAYRIELRARRNVAATRRLLATRRAVRDEATSWLRSRTTADLSAISALPVARGSSVSARPRTGAASSATCGSR